MKYLDPNFNIIVCSPGRTGSAIYKKIFCDITEFTPKYRDHTKNIEPLKPKELLHSHNAQDIKLINENTMCILSKRNLIDSTFSQCIAKQYNVWSYYSKDNIIQPNGIVRLRNDPIIKPFILSKEIFIHEYNVKKNFYETLKPILPENHLVIDYTEYCDDVSKLFKILKLSSKLYNVYFPFFTIKTPGNYADWIINYEEIFELSRSLESNPCI